MKNKGKIILCITLLLTQSISASVQAQSKNIIHVLYIGNSLLTTHEMPKLLADIASSKGYEIIYEVIAPGGKTLSQHLADPYITEVIKKKSWDFVVLQEQTQITGFKQEHLRKQIYPQIEKLVQIIKKNSQKTQVVFYQTMARKDGDPDNAYISAELNTYEGAQKRINHSYYIMARDNQARIAPVGKAWMEARAQREEINLYTYDNIRPNIAGTYLIACVFFSTFFLDSPLGIDRPLMVDNKTAEFLQDIAYRTVFLSQSKWNLTSP